MVCELVQSLVEMRASHEQFQCAHGKKINEILLKSATLIPLRGSKDSAGLRATASKEESAPQVAARQPPGPASVSRRRRASKCQAPTQRQRQRPAPCVGEGICVELLQGCLCASRRKSLWSTTLTVSCAIVLVVCGSCHCISRQYVEMS